MEFLFFNPSLHGKPMDRFSPKFSGQSRGNKVLAGFFLVGFYNLKIVGVTWPKVKAMDGFSAYSQDMLTTK